MAHDKIVLAYSGGLDTSIAIRYLKEKYKCDCIAFAADVGQGGDFSFLKKKALKAGASKVHIKDLRKEFVMEYIFPSLRAGAIYESGYYLATALSRPLIAKHQIAVAKKEGARCVAHGCTGKGNDQVRFETTYQILAPELKVIAPLREWDLPSREAEMRYAKKHGIPVEATKKSPFSLDKNLWGVSIECGPLEDPYSEPPKEAYQWTKAPEEAPKKPTYMEITFEKGLPNRLNGKSLDGVGIITKLNEVGSQYGIGRSDMVENRLVGIKSRELYEAPAACILHTAHRELEALTLDRELLHYKQGVSLKYAELIYYGLWFSLLRLALDRFVDETQRFVTGEVRLKLVSGAAIVVGRKSPYSLYKKSLATYEAGDEFDKNLARGFIKIWGMPYATRTKQGDSA